jgi:cell division protease FtsH
VSIIPHGVAALGFTLQLPVEDKFLSTKAELSKRPANYRFDPIVSGLRV